MPAVPRVATLGQHGTLAGLGLQAVLLLHMLRHWPVGLDHTMASCFVNGSTDGMNQQGGTGGIPVVVAHLPHKGAQENCGGGGAGRDPATELGWAVRCGKMNRGVQGRPHT
jgi:hypothetical protein